jgi:hypothetical protein
LRLPKRQLLGGFRIRWLHCSFKRCWFSRQAASLKKVATIQTF